MTLSRSAAFALAALLGCALWLAFAGGQVAVGAPAASQAMYESEQIVGTILKTELMYRAKEHVWYSAELRVDEVAERGKLKLGDVIAVRYGVPNVLPASLAPKADTRIKGEGMLRTAKGKTWYELAEPGPAPRRPAVRPGKNPKLDLGSPDARVLVKMFAPLQTDCHMKTMELLKAFSEREPERVRIQIWDMRSAEGREEMRTEGLGCATVLVNSVSEFTIPQRPRPRHVALTKKPNVPGATYRSEDVITIIEKQLKVVYR